MSGLPQRFSLYYACFRETLSRRMRYVNKITFLVAVSASLILRLPYGRFWWTFVDSLWRVPVLFVALWLVKAARIQNSTVAYAPAKSLAEHLATLTVLSRRFLGIVLFFVASAWLVFAVFLTQLALMRNYYVLAKEFRVKPAVNDTWVYFWYHATAAGVLYTVQHLAFQRNRLPLAYGQFSKKPETALFADFAGLAGSSLFFGACTTVVAPVLYIFVRPLLYKLGWVVIVVLGLDTAVPPLHIAAGTLVHVTFASTMLFLTWEFVSHTYNVYATIGCLDGKHAISARSPDPVATIIGGLRDLDPAHEMVRTTAYQELAYLATADDEYCVKTRNAIFNASPRANAPWPAILDECLLVVRQTAANINYRSKSDMDALRSTELVPKEGPADVGEAQKDPVIFGNSHDTTSNDTTQFAVSATSSPLKKSTAFEPVKPSGFAKAVSKLGVFSAAWDQLNRYAEALYSPHTTRQKAQLSAGVSTFHTALYQAYAQFLDSSVGVLFRTTAKRDAESRVPNPAMYASAVVALAGLVKRAVEEDRSETVTINHVSEVLNTLERPIRSSANYTDILPASVYVSAAQKADSAQKNHHLVAAMHDLTMTEFFQLCVKYNYKLNDLLLLARAFKLAKWVLEVSAAHQQKLEKVQLGKVL